MKKFFSELTSSSVFSILLAGGLLTAAEPEISFSFDQSLKNDKPFAELNGKGEAQWRPVINASCIDPANLLISGGLTGNALHTGSITGKNGHDFVSYYLKDGFVSATEGSFSFWMKAVDWDGYDRKSHVFLRMRSSSDESLLAVAQNRLGAFQVRLIHGVLKDGVQNIHVDGVKKDWIKGEWHHIAATWGKGKLSLYLDGNFINASDFVPAKNDYSLLTLGENWQPEPGSTLLDEVRIFRKTLSDEEVRDEYQRLAEKANGGNRPFEVTLSERSPRLDGVVQPGEYAAGFALMHETRSKQAGLYAEYQPQCYLSYDTENIYFAMVSRGDDLRRTIKEHDGNVWEDDCVEFYLSRSGTPADIYHFIINADGVIYDSQLQVGQEKKQWDAKGMQLKSSIVNGQWVLEGAIPWSNFGFLPKSGENFFFNFCRSYRGNLKADFALDQNLDTEKKKINIRECSVSISNGVFADAGSYGKVTFGTDTPAFELQPFGLLTNGKLGSELSFYPKNADNVMADISTGNDKKDFKFNSTIPLAAGKTAVKTIEGVCEPDGTLKVSLASEEYGKLLRASLAYQKPTLLKFKSFQTDIPKMQLVFVTEGGDDSGENCAVRIQMKDWKTEKIVYDQKQQFKLQRGLIPLRFDLNPLPPGIYDLLYEFSDAQGKILHQDYEYFAKPDGKAPWEGTKAGLVDIVPPPWTQVAAGNGDFSCWGRNYRLGGAGLFTSIKSQDRELLNRPVTLVLDGKPLKFTAELVKKGISFADYRLTADSKIPLSVDIHAEFDGLMWCTATIGEADSEIKSLELEIPLSRENANAFDDCSTIYEKQDFSQCQTLTIYNDPTKKPFFWCGSSRVGLMGGIDNCHGWYFQNKKQGSRLSVTKEEAVATLHFIDTPLKLKQSRHIEFYLQATPTKLKSTEAGKIDPLHTRVTFYQARFFEWKTEGQVIEGHMKQFLDMARNDNIRWFHYFASKGSSPLFPWWGWYGSDWNMLGDPNWFQQEFPYSTRKERDRGIWTWTCMNSRNFTDHKLDAVQWYLGVERYQVRDLYFDLAWPYPCRNPNHGCKWVDEFGYTHFDYDMRALRDFHKRVYTMMKQKTPSALMMGHIRYTRTPSDVFFDLQTVGESYEQQVTEKHNYYEIFTPEALRILYGFRTNETSILLGPQIYRTIQVYKPNELKNFSAYDPKIDQAQRHYLAYVKCHNFIHDIYKRNGEEAQLVHLGKVLQQLGTLPRFYAYWEPECGLRAVNPHPRFLYGAYAGNEKVLIIALNDTDKTVQNVLEIDPKLLKLPSEYGTDVFNKQQYRIQNNRLSFDLPPRESRFVLFEAIK